MLLCKTVRAAVGDPDLLPMLAIRALELHHIRLKFWESEKLHLDVESARNQTSMSCQGRLILNDAYRDGRCLKLVLLLSFNAIGFIFSPAELQFLA